MLLHVFLSCLTLPSARAGRVEDSLVDELTGMHDDEASWPTLPWAGADRTDDFTDINVHGDSLIDESLVGCETQPPCAENMDKPIFFDMIHSNNAARIRLFIRMFIKEEQLPICMVTYADMRCPWFEKVNPNKKVPGLIIDGETLIESNVIFEYLVDRYGIFESDVISDYFPHLVSLPSFKHKSLSAMERAKINLMMRVHDLYVASPNCNQFGCTHSQGGLYLPPPGKFDRTGGRRAVDAKTRAGKFAELWTRWTWLEGVTKGPYLAGNFLSMADFSWFPTAVFMEFLLVHVAEWPALFADTGEDDTGHVRTVADFTAADSYGDWVSSEPWNPGFPADDMIFTFPKLVKWYPQLLKLEVFRKVRSEILGFWLNERHLDTLGDGRERLRRFTHIKNAIADAPTEIWKPVKSANGGLEWPEQTE